MSYSLATEVIASRPTRVNRSNNLTKGVVIALLGYLCLALMNVSGKMLADIPTPILVFFQFSTGLLFSLPGGLKQGWSGLKTPQPKLIFLRAFSGLLNVSALFFALKHIPLVDAVVLQNTAPLFVPLIVWLWFKKTIPHRVWIALAIGFMGVMFIVKPSMNQLNIGTLSGLAAGLLSAVSMVAISRMKIQGEPTSRISFYLMFISTLASLPFVLAHLDIVAGLNWHQWLLLCLLGFFTYACQTLITHAFAYGSTHTLAALSYTVVAFSGLLGWAIWGHVPDWLAVLGIIAVSTGGILGIIWGGVRS